MEKWKDIIDYEGLYQVSNLGRIKRLERVIHRGNCKAYILPETIVGQTRNSDGYLVVKLRKDNIRRTIGVHRLVAKTFIDKPSKTGVYEVNHINYKRDDNRVDNLEWVTHIENVRYSIPNRSDISGNKNPNYGNRKLSEFYKNNKDIAQEKQSRKGTQNGMCKKIALYSKDLTIIENFAYIGECAKYLQIINYTSAKENAIRSNIWKSIKQNKPYLNFYYKYCA